MCFMEPVNILSKQRFSHWIIKAIALAYKCAGKEAPPIEWYVSSDLTKRKCLVTQCNLGSLRERNETDQGCPPIPLIFQSI